MKKGRYPQAYKNLCRLRFTELQAARDSMCPDFLRCSFAEQFAVYFIHVQLELENKIVRADSFIRRFTELVTIPRVRRATMASGTVMLCAFTSYTLFSR